MRSKNGVHGAALVVALVALLGGSAQAAPAGAATPQQAMVGFLEASRAGDYTLAASFLDLTRRDSAKGPTLARHLKFVLDQTLWVDVDALANEPEGDLADGEKNRDVVGEIESSGADVAIALSRGGDGRWRVSRSTVAAIGPLYAELGLGPLGEVLPTFMFAQIWELQLWQWIALPLLVVIAYVFSALVTALGLRLALRVTRKTRTDLDDAIVKAGSAPLTVAILLGVFVLGTLSLGLALPAQNLIFGLAEGLAIVAVTWLAIRLIDVAALTLENRLADRGETTAVTVIPVGRRIAKIFLLVIAILAGLQNLGFNVVSLIAGLGVVGIAVALGSQKTFEHFFGTVEILVDRPVQRGDFCRFGDKVGVVEDIGLRSTRIRTLDRTLVTVPNSEFASLQLENFGARDRIRFTTVLGLRYETSADQLRHVLIGLKRLLVEHERVVDDPARVRFVGFGAFSLDVEVWTYLNTQDWAEFLAIREDLLLRMIDIVAESGTGFAFPSQTLYLGQDDGLDAPRTRGAEQQVAAWRAQRELSLPDFPPERVRELENRLAYPPEGSALAPTRPGGGAEE